MKAVRLYAPGDLRVEDVAPPPAPPAGHVNLRVKAAGICGSDLHNYRTGQWISRSPSTAGHEFCGEVIAVAPDVTDVRPGDMVVADSRVWCGSCAACRSGRSNVCEMLGFVGEACDGGFAEQVQLPSRLLVRCDAALDPRVAAMAEPLAVALHAVRRLAPPAKEPVLVTGCGTIGGLCALVLSRLHDGPVLVADRHEGRRALVQQVTGAMALDLEDRASGPAAGGLPLRYAIDATGNVKAIEAALARLSGGGALALVGIGHGTLALDPTMLVEREIALVGCHAFTTELADAVAMLPALQESLLAICEPIASLDAFPAVYESLLQTGSTKLKSVVRLP